MDDSGKARPFSLANQENLIVDVIEPMAKSGLRTISLAYKDFVVGRLSSLFKGYKRLHWVHLIQSLKARRARVELFPLSERLLTEQTSDVFSTTSGQTVMPPGG